MKTSSALRRDSVSRKQAFVPAPSNHHTPVRIQRNTLEDRARQTRSSNRMQVLLVLIMLIGMAAIGFLLYTLFQPTPTISLP